MHGIAEDANGIDRRCMQRKKIKVKTIIRNAILIERN